MALPDPLKVLTPAELRDIPNVAEDETFTVKVFREHEAWGRYAKWWQLPVGLANELYICAYECDGAAQLAWVRQEHPECVLVY
jgi:alpha-D-ribose 1-methylphosphonate 5-phosphate C-P lyase